ncbi:MAG: acyltransferase, partial [Acidimicrobiia bacterium]|nr:acyltransferase [Acidimicrobiia bacterium]
GGPYPVALIGVPGESFSITTPPTIVLFAQALVQVGIISVLAEPVKRWLAGRKAWAAVVLVSGMIMSLYVWHLTAMVLTIGLATLAGNVGFAVEPMTALWWLSRPVWFAVLSVPLFGFVAIFGRYEQRAQDGDLRPAPWALGLGIVLSAAALASSAAFGVARVDDFPLRWWVPLLLIIGTFLTGMTTLGPSRRRRT